jgi:hypothetical protein
MVVENFSETTVNIHQSTRRHILERFNLQYLVFEVMFLTQTPHLCQLNVPVDLLCEEKTGSRCTGSYCVVG